MSDYKYKELKLTSCDNVNKAYYVDFCRQVEIRSTRSFDLPHCVINVDMDVFGEPTGVEVLVGNYI